MSIGMYVGKTKVATAAKASKGSGNEVVLDGVAWVGGQGNFTNYVDADVVLQSDEWSGRFRITGIRGSGNVVTLRPN